LIAIKINKIEFHCRNIEDHLWLLQTAKNKNKSIPLLAEKIQAKFTSSIDNIVASESEILIYGSNGFKLDILDGIELGWASIKNKIFPVHVNLDQGLDWDRVIKISGKTILEFKQMLLKSKFTVCMYGFRPGFLYLNGLAPPYHIPRMELPRKEVMAGSLALGGKYIGIYGSSAPAGWNIIGQTNFVIKDFQSVDSLPSIKQKIKFIIEE